jgi:DNA-binding transcriptional ArsR family regulator
MTAWKCYGVARHEPMAKFCSGFIHIQRGTELVRWIGKVHPSTMSTEPSIPSTPSSPAAPSAPQWRPAVAAMARSTSRLTVEKVCGALSSGVRRRALRRLLEVQQPMSVSQLASKERLSPDAMSRHLQIMEKAGVLASHSGVDRRCSCYFLPMEFQQEAGWIDFGVVKVRREEI